MKKLLQEVNLSSLHSKLERVCLVLESYTPARWYAWTFPPLSK